MNTKQRAIFIWTYAAIAVLTFLAVVAISGFEIYVRWQLNQNYAALHPGALEALMVLLGAELLGLLWYVK